MSKDRSNEKDNKILHTGGVRRSFPHEKVNLRIEDIEGMISTYEFLVWKNEGEDKEHCKRVLRQLKKSVNYT